jgi:outer membrane lipoprotein-sorting protein
MTNPDQDLIDMITNATPEPPISDDHRERLRRQALEAYDERAVDSAPDTRPNPLFKIKGTTVMKFAASIALLSAIAFFAITALTPSKAIAFEDVAREILKIENARFEITSTITYADGTTEDEGTYKCVTKLPNLLRADMPQGDTMVIDFAKDKMLVIDPKKKAALVMDEFLQLSEDDNLQKNLFGEIQNHLRNAEKGGDFGAIKYENLGEKKINGTQAVGFRVLNPGANVEDEDADALGFNTLDIWADAKTGGPISLQFTLVLEDDSKVTSTFKNFVYNQELDPKLFSFEAPEGYELIDGNNLIRVGQVFGGEDEIGEGLADAQQEAEALADDIEVDIEALVKELQKHERATSKDVIEALRGYAEQTGGKLPDTLESGPMIDAMVEAWEKANPGKPLFKEGDTISFADEKLERNYETILQAARFLGTLEGSGGIYTYRGNGVTADDPPTPVLWLQSAGASAYTVIYNDFSTKDTNRGPHER